MQLRALRSSAHDWIRSKLLQLRMPYCRETHTLNRSLKSMEEQLATRQTQDARCTLQGTFNPTTVSVGFQKHNANNLVSARHLFILRSPHNCL
jgi:hypothetical protein